MTDSNGKDSPTFILECQARAAGFYEVDFGLDSRIDELRGVHRIVSDILQSLAASPRMPKRVLKAPAGSEQRPDRLVQAWIKSTWANLELLAPAFRAFPQLTCLSHTLSSGPIHLRSQVLRRSSLTLSALQQILPLLGQKPVADQARCVLIAILSGISRYSPDSASALLLALSRTLDGMWSYFLSLDVMRDPSAHVYHTHPLISLIHSLYLDQISCLIGSCKPDSILFPFLYVLISLFLKALGGREVIERKSFPYPFRWMI